ncbi:hypothetical protein KBK19_18015 [Microvirga sp. STR05]|uniref:DUF3311 domain-containing protein n=1 Tax=Hymenobacter duratus TaxID=2771356 RepID=A0ABR8JJB1_9BACT|nr:hypothetical protein [Hymenobacter duratus]MBD2716946.1 hypothetical protein [Hymenobacter duratus]MBR7951862.1 hypothetical protein [Microvirga sp. STR05]
MPPISSQERPEQRRGQRLLFVSLLFAILLNFPLLAVFDHDGRVAGIPVLYLYVLLAWCALVLLTGWLVRRISN